jgi:hypothetical protein
MKRDNFFMNFTKIHKKKSDEYDINSHMLTNATKINPSLSWHNQDDSKSDGQQLTTVNNSGQPNRGKGSPGGIKAHHTTARTSDHERED